MTSTFPTSRSTSQNLRNGIKEIQSKREALLALEVALKKRINEFRELCLKEGELTGHLPIDYPLQPREPIPQVRRKVTRSNGNLSNETSFQSAVIGMPGVGTLKSRPNLTSNNFAIPQLPMSVDNNSHFPSRPTSTNSSNSSTSTASSNARSLNQLIRTIDESMRLGSVKEDQHLKTTHDNLQATAPQRQMMSSGDLRQTMSNNRSSPPSINNNNHLHSNQIRLDAPGLRMETVTRPPRGQFHVTSASFAGQASDRIAPKDTRSTTLIRQKNFNSTENPSIGSRNPIGSVESYKIDTVTKYQPYYEETKPFQMSDFYKYSSKHRQSVLKESSPLPPCFSSEFTTASVEQPKTTRQLQEEVARARNALRFANCDDQIQASVRLIEKSGQKLIEATAKAIAGNPGLAEKLNGILPNHGERC